MSSCSIPRICYHGCMEYKREQFEEYNAAGGRITPIVTFGKTGGLYMSAGFTKKYEISQDTYKGVKLYYDRVNEIIAIKFLKESESGMLGLKLGQSGGAFLNSKSFAIKYDMVVNDLLKEKYQGKFDPIDGNIDGIGKVILIKLTEKRK